MWSSQTSCRGSRCPNRAVVRVGCAAQANGQSALGLSRFISARLLLAGVVCLVGCGATKRQAPEGLHTPAEGSPETTKLFALLAGYEGNAEADRLEDAGKSEEAYKVWEKACLQALHELARTKEGEAWMVNLLLSRLPKEQRGADAALLDVRLILKDLPETAAPPVLWAVTSYLQDERRLEVSGTYEEGGRVWKYKGHSQPVRDFAKEVLERALGVDLGYDVTAWRFAILRQSRQAAAPTTK